jgi:hypothetical protein
MNRRIATYAAVATAILGLGLLVRWVVGVGASSPPQNATQATLREIDARRQSGSAADRSRLAELASHEDERVSRAAILALGASPGGNAETLARLMTEGKTGQIRGAAAEAFAIRPEADAAPLTSMLRGDPDPEARAGAARGLVRISSPERRDAVPDLLAALRDPDGEVRAWAIRGVYQVSVKRFPYDPRADPASQEENVRYIERRLREMGLR